MKKIPLALVALISLMLIFSGCIKINWNIKVNSDGKGDYAATIDMGGIGKMAAGMQNAFDQNGSGSGGTSIPPEMPDEYKKENMCATLQSGGDSGNSMSFGEGFDPKDAECTALDDYKARLDWKNVDFVEKNLLKIDEKDGKKTFTFSVKGSQQEQQQVNAESAQQLKATGMELNMNIEMPGKIASTTAGKISPDKKSVSIDLIDEIGKISSGITVVSEEETGMSLLTIGLMALVILLVLGLIFVRKK